MSTEGPWYSPDPLTRARLEGEALAMVWRAREARWDLAERERAKHGGEMPSEQSWGGRG